MHRKQESMRIDRMNPLLMHYRVNAGYIALDHWVHGEEGAGELLERVAISSICLHFFTDCKVKQIYTTTLTPKTKSVSPR